MNDQDEIVVVVDKDDNFLATSVLVRATKFEGIHNRSLMLAMALFLGVMGGAIYVLFLNALRKRKEKSAKAQETFQQPCHKHIYNIYSISFQQFPS